MTSSHLSITRKPEIRNFLNEPLIARMATCDPTTLQPHVVPVWYLWDENSIWISSFKSTRKITELKANPRISIVIDTDSPGHPAQAVIFEGVAEIVLDPSLGIEIGTRVYTRYLGEAGAQAEEPQSWLHDSDHLLIRLKPMKIISWGF